MTSLVGESIDLNTETDNSFANESSKSRKNSYLNGMEVGLIVDKADTTGKMQIIHSINDILYTRLQYVTESGRRELHAIAVRIDISSTSLESLQSIYKDFIFQFIGRTEGWERQIELFPLAIDVLLEESTKAGSLATGGRSKMHALLYAACIGNTNVIERAKQILGNKLPENLNRGETLPLFIAISMGQYEFAKALIAAGADINGRNDFFECILHTLIRTGNHESIEFVLCQKGVDLNIKDAFDNTTLHKAVIMRDTSMVALLLKNEIIAAQKQEKNMFGQTPLDIALQEKNDDIIKLLVDDSTIDIHTLPGYGITPSVIGQDHILGKFAQFLNLKKEQDEQMFERDKDQLSSEEKANRQRAIRDPSVLPTGGHCNGLSMLFQYYSFKDKEEEFYTVMDLISQWDGKEESLRSTESLKGLSGDYKDLEDLMEQWIYDIVWFQQCSNLGLLFPFQQQDRVSQFEITRKYEDDKITSALPVCYCFTKEQLAEWLQIRSYFPGSIIEFSGSQHNTSVQILPQEKAKYYDSNFQYRISPFISMERLAEVIYRTKHLGLGKTRDKMDESVMIYQMFSGDQPKGINLGQTTPHMFLEQASPNGYSKLHFAILFNDIDLFNAELAEQTVQVNIPNAHGHTLIHDAIVFGREEIVEKLLNVKDIDLSQQTNRNDLLRLAIQYRHRNIVKILINRGFEIAGEHIYAAVQTDQKDVLRALVAQGVKPADINYASMPRLERPLHIAIYQQDKEVIKILLENGASLKVGTLERERSPLSCIADSRNVEFLKFIVNSLANLNEVDEEGFTLRDYATRKGNSVLEAILQGSS